MGTQLHYMNVHCTLKMYNAKPKIAQTKTIEKKRWKYKHMSQRKKNNATVDKQ